jgi:hypothetical protein
MNARHWSGVYRWTGPYPVHNPVHGIEQYCSIYGFHLEPPIGIEPMTYALRVRRSDRLS